MTEGKQRQRSGFWRIAFLLVPLSLAGVAYVNADRARVWLGDWLALDASVAGADAVVVLGGGGAERLEHGVRLYHEQSARELWCTGGEGLDAVSRRTPVREVREFAVIRGVPADAIRVLPSRSTWEDAGEIGATAASTGFKRLLIVTSWYHSRRAMRSLEKVLDGRNVELFFSPVPTSPFTPSDWWRSEQGRSLVQAEVSKSFYYAWHFGVALR